MAKVAIVDDSEIALEWAKEGLERWGHEVVTHRQSSGVAAFVRNSGPQLLLLDVNMSGLQGDHVCKLLKADPGTREVKIALYSALPEDKLEELAQRVGADGFIIKPDNVADLHQAVKEMLGG